MKIQARLFFYHEEYDDGSERVTVSTLPPTPDEQSSTGDVKVRQHSMLRTIQYLGSVDLNVPLNTAPEARKFTRFAEIVDD